MKKTFVLAVAAIAAAVGSMVGIAADNGSDAEATWGDRRRCATHRELTKLHLGAPMAKVHRIIDAKGWRTSFYRSSYSGDRWEDRRYRVCGGGEVEVSYFNGRATDLWTTYEVYED